MATIKTRLTADEYSKLPETTQPMELIDGEIIVSPAPLDSHQEITINILRMICLRCSIKNVFIY